MSLPTRTKQSGFFLSWLCYGFKYSWYLLKLLHYKIATKPRFVHSPLKRACLPVGMGNSHAKGVGFRGSARFHLPPFLHSYSSLSLIALFGLGIIAGLAGIKFYQQHRIPPPPGPGLYSFNAQSKNWSQPKTSFSASEPVSYILSLPEKFKLSWLQQLPIISVKSAIAAQSDSGTATTTNGDTTITAAVYALRDNPTASSSAIPTSATPSQTLNVALTPQGSDQVAVTVTPFQSRTMEPGGYVLKITVTTGWSTREYLQDFSWGVLALNFDKSSYLPGETASFAFAVLSSHGGMDCEAQLELKISNAASGGEETLSTGNGTIVKNPDCYVYGVNPKPDYEANYTVKEAGDYTLTLTAQTQQGAYTVSDTLKVENAAPFTIKRLAHTRIYPVDTYPMIIEVTANQDFEGMIEDIVPISFQVLAITDELLSKAEISSHPELVSGSPQVTEAGQEKHLSWQVNLNKGQTITLAYAYDAPDVSPDFYLLGKLQFFASSAFIPSPEGQAEGRGVLFSEPRLWQLAIDATKTWDGGGANTNFTTCGNWNLDTCPVAGDTLVFDSTSAKDASVDASFSLTTNVLNMNAGYTGTVSMARNLTVASMALAAGTFTVGSYTLASTGTYNQTGGTFNGGTGVTDYNGDFSLSAGTFTATAGNMYAAKNFAITGSPTFNHNSGTITFDSSTGSVTATCAGVVFNAVKMNKMFDSTSITFASDCTLPIANTNPTSSGTITNNGTINITGNWTHNGGYVANVGSTLTMTGTVFNSSGSNTSNKLTLNGGTIPSSLTSMTIGANLTFNGGSLPSSLTSLVVNNSIVFTTGPGTWPAGLTAISIAGVDNSGNYLPNDLDLTITYPANSTITCGNATFRSVTINKQVDAYSVTFNSDCTIPIAGTNPTSTGQVINNGTINVTGNWTIAGGYRANSGSTLNMTGTTLSTAAAGNGNLNLLGGTIPDSITTVITGDDLTLNGGSLPSSLTSLTVGRNFILTASPNPWPVGLTAITVGGNLNNTNNLLPNNLNLTFHSTNNSTLTCAGQTVGNLTINKTFSSYSLTLADNCTVNNLTFTQGTVSNPASSKTLTVQGNFSQSANMAFGGANLTVLMSGGNAQTLSQTAGTFPSVFLVNKTGGSISLASNFTTGSSCTIQAGIFDLNGNSFTCGSTFTVQNGATIRLVGNETTVTTPILDSGSLVEYKGDNNSQTNTIHASDWPYKSLTVNTTDALDVISTNNSLSNHLAGYWPMDEGSGTTTADTSGHGFTATLSNATFSTTLPTVSFTDPYSMNFNGVSSYLDFGSTLDIARNKSALTLAAWVRFTSAAGTQNVIYISGSNPANPRARFYESVSGMGCDARAGDGEATRSITTSAGLFAANTWYHVMCVIDYANNTIRIYKNGTIIGQNLTAGFTANSTSDTPSATNIIGSNYQHATTFFYGHIDDLRVYDRILYPYEIALLVNGQSSDAFTQMTVPENLTVSSGTFVAPSTLTIGGNLTNNGTLDALTNNSTVVFDDITKTSVISGSGSPALTFYNLTSTTPGKALRFTEGKTFQVNGLLTLTGNEGSHVSIDSTTTSPWYINYQNASPGAVTYTTVANSSCDPASTAIAVDRTNTNGGNNGPCWGFPNPIPAVIKGGTTIKGGVTFGQ